MSNYPLVSIIVPCYRQADVLHETLDSVKNQKYPNWECIIVNDGSPDSTESVANYYCHSDNRFKYYYQSNAGISSARNAGIKLARGEYILPLDSDDIISKDYVRLAVDYFIEHPKCKLVYCKANFFGYINEPWDLGVYSFERLKWQNCIFCSALYRKRDFEKTQGYNTNMVYGWEDWDFWLSLLKEDDWVHMIDEVHFFYRRKSESRSTIADNYKSISYHQIQVNHPELYSDVEYSALEYFARANSLREELKRINNSIPHRIVHMLGHFLHQFKRFIFAFVRRGRGVLRG